MQPKTDSRGERQNREKRSEKGRAGEGPEARRPGAATVRFRRTGRERAVRPVQKFPCRPPGDSRTEAVSLFPPRTGPPHPRGGRAEAPAGRRQREKSRGRKRYFRSGGGRIRGPGPGVESQRPARAAHAGAHGRAREAGQARTLHAQELGPWAPLVTAPNRRTRYFSGPSGPPRPVSADAWLGHEGTGGARLSAGSSLHGREAHGRDRCAPGPSSASKPRAAGQPGR